MWRVSGEGGADTLEQHVVQQRLFDQGDASPRGAVAHGRTRMGGDQDGRQIDLAPSQLNYQVQAVHIRQLIVDDEVSVFGDIGIVSKSKSDAGSNLNALT
jgi:hypothetical protein